MKGKVKVGEVVNHREATIPTGQQLAAFVGSLAPAPGTIPSVLKAKIGHNVNVSPF